MREQASPDLQEDRMYVYGLIERIVKDCPYRQPASADERKASIIMEQELRKAGLATSMHRFTFNDNLYANLALHFGIGSAATFASGIAPGIAFLAHASVGLSYLLESTRKAYILRRLFKFKPSQNVLGVFPAQEGPDLRIVVVAHVDAAFTGFMFDEKVVKMTASTPSGKLSFLHKGLALATWTQLGLAGFDLLRMLLGPLTLPLRPLEYVLNLPGLITFLLNAELLVRNRLVPGANDDLSGVAALPVLASRLGPRKPRNVELVFVATGCEEASLGGCDSLLRDMEDVWDRERTVFIGLDCLTNGELRYLHPEGEVVSRPVPGWIRETIENMWKEKGMEKVEPFEPPVGGSDISAVLAHGYDGVCLTCVVPELGSPTHYHLPSDTPENLDMDRLMKSIDFAEGLVESIWKRRLDTGH